MGLFWLAVLVTRPVLALPISAADLPPTAGAASQADDPARLAAALAVADAAVRNADQNRQREPLVEFSLGLKPPAAGLTFKQPALGTEPVLGPALHELRTRAGGNVAADDPMSERPDSARVSGPIRTFLLALRADPSYAFLRAHQRMLLGSAGFVLLSFIGVVLLMRRNGRLSRQTRRRRRSEPVMEKRAGRSLTSGRHRRRQRTGHAR